MGWSGGGLASFSASYLAAYEVEASASSTRVEGPTAVPGVPIGWSWSNPFESSGAGV